MRAKLVRWGEQVHRIFTSGSLSLFAGSGVDVSQDIRFSASLDRAGLREFRDGSADAIATEESEVLAEWLSSRTVPLLILAPFGAGKSVLMSAFAIQIADRLRRGVFQTEEEQTAFDRLQVPLPIRLREWIRFRAAYPHDRAAELWLRFILESLREFSPDPSIEILTSEEFSRLQRDNRLVLLFDGFDELPIAAGTGASCTSRLEVLQFIRAFSPQFILSSRNYYEAENDRMFSEEMRNVLRVRELQPDQIRDYIRRFFSRPQDTDTQRLALDVHESLTPQSERFLSRPLFLAAWCTQIPRDGSRPGGSIESLMLGLFRQLVLHRSKSLALDDAISGGSLPFHRSDALADRVGLVLCAFAHSEYSANLSPQRVHEICAKWLPTEPLDGIRETLDASIGLGLLMRLPGGELWCPKLPIVEFLVGRVLSRLGAGSHAHKQAFVQLFRRWTYLPETYEAMDHAFDLLANGSQRPWLQSLLKWLCNVSQNEPYRAAVQRRPVDCAACDDLVRPASWRAFRLACRCLPEILGEVSKVCAISVVGSRDIGKWLPSLWDARAILNLLSALTARYAEAKYEAESTALYQAIRDVIDRLGGQWVAQIVEHGMDYCQKARHDEERRIWHEILWYAALRVPCDAAENLIERIVHQYWRDESEESPCQPILCNLATCVDSRLAVRAVERWIACWSTATDPNERLSWENAIQNAAKNVEQRRAAATIEQWIDRHNSVDETGQRKVWRSAILAASSRIEEAGAAQVVERLIERYWGTSEVTERKEWGWAIRTAAACVGEHGATQLVHRLMEEYDPTTNPEQRRIWLSAILSASGKVNEPSATQLAEEWLRRHTNVLDSADKKACLEAISVVAERMDRISAAQLVERLVEQYADAPDPEEKDPWHHAIVRAAGRVSLNEVELPLLVEKWLARHKTATDHQRRAWKIGIGNLARKIDDRSAADVVERWVPQHPSEDESHASAWRSAIMAVANRIQPQSAAWVLNRWIKQHDSTEEKSERQSWRDAILSATSQLDDKSLVEVLGRLIERYEQAKLMRERLDWRLAIVGSCTNVDEHAPQVLDQLIQLLDKAADYDECMAWFHHIKTMLKKAFASSSAKGVARVLLERGIDDLAVEIAVASDAVVLWMERDPTNGTENDHPRLTFRERQDEAVILDSDLRFVPDDIHEVIQWPFARKQSYSPAEQYQKLKQAIQMLRPEVRGFPDGKTASDQKNRNNWLSFFRDQLDPQTECHQEAPGKPWVIRKDAFDRLLTNTPLLEHFIATRDALKPRKMRR